MPMISSAWIATRIAFIEGIMKTVTGKLDKEREQEAWTLVHMHAEVLARLDANKRELTNVLKGAARERQEQAERAKAGTEVGR